MPASAYQAIIAGAQTVLGQLARLFRLGRYGAVQPEETAAQSRPRLESAAEIITEILREADTLPLPASSQLSTKFIFVVYNAETNERLDAIPVILQYSAGTPSSTLYSRARRAGAAAIRTDPSLAFALIAETEGVPLRFGVARVKNSTIEIPPAP